jgi:hypothetical protein
MYKIVTITEDNVQYYVVLNVVTKLEVSRYDTYEEAFKDVLSR